MGVLHGVITVEDEYNTLYKDGSYEFGYTNPDSYHYADGNRNNVVKGEFGGRNPKTGAIDSTIYTAGPRGYRPRGKNVVRKYDLSQSGPRAIGSPDDPVGDVNGRYSYTDDVGERHNVEFVAGKNTGFHVKTPFPDSNPRAYGPLYFNGRGKPIPRGRTSIQRGLDGSYRFVSAGPDQRRTEVSDSTGHVRGSYTYLDDKGVQHSVHYIAGPETGYRILKQVKGPHLPTVFPFGGNTETSAYDDNEVTDKPRFGDKSNKPSYDGDEEDTDDFGDLFGGSSTTSPRPSGDRRDGYKPSTPKPDEDGSYKPSGDDGSYKPSSTTPEPSDGTGIPEEPDQGGGGYPSGAKPSTSFEDGGSSSGGGDNFGLFGSETNHPKPPRPYGDRPSISVRPYDDRCLKCDDTIITNLGDSYFSVPPGVSVRAHVQAIDLLPLTPKVPSPSEQYRADLSRSTEQLNAPKDEIVQRDGPDSEHTIDYFGGQDARFLSAAMTLPLADRPLVPKYFFIPRHIYPCTANHSKEEHGELNVEPLPSTESSTSTSTSMPTSTPMESTEASTGQATEENKLPLVVVRQPMRVVKQLLLVVMQLQ
nr:unnamed protein product [Callosobruchus analis]